MQNDECRLQNENQRAEFDSAICIHHSALAFTLTELLVVISIIVLMLGLAVPVLKILGGGKSIESAEDQIAAVIGRARAQAISDRTVAGVMFYLDTKDARVKAAIVEQSPATITSPSTADISLDLATDTLSTDGGVGGNAVADIFSLPPGIGVQLINNCSVDTTTTPPTRNADGYIGFNFYNNYNGAGSPPGVSTVDTATSPPLSGVAYGGVILFDASGKLLASKYIFHTAMGGAIGVAYTKLGQLLFGTGQYDMTAASNMDFVSPSSSVNSQYGLVVFDHDAFLSLGYSDQDPVVEDQLTKSTYQGTTWTDSTNGSKHQSEQAEENWLDQNSTPLIIDRYDGSLIRGE